MNQICKRIMESHSSKLGNQLVQNEQFIAKLTQLESNGLLDSPKAIVIYTNYTSLQLKLNKQLPSRMINKFHPKSETTSLILPYIDPTDKISSCQICGFPVTELLTKHHIVPKSKGGKFGPTVKLCATCHTMLHHSAQVGYISEAIIDYYSPIDDAVDKIKMYIDTMEK